MNLEDVGDMNIKCNRMKKQFAKEWLFLLIVIMASCFIAYFIMPKWGWDNRTNESIQLLNIKVMPIAILTAYALRITIVSIKTILKRN